MSGLPQTGAGFVNAIRGGLSVFLPVDEVLSATRKNHLKLAIAGSCLIFMTIFTLFILHAAFCDQTVEKAGGDDG